MQRKTNQASPPHPEGNQFAIELVRQVAQLNKGVYLDHEIKNGSATNFCTGVAGYPEKHFEAPNLESDIRQLKSKIEAGAEYIITQMFFNNQKYFDFVNACKTTGINIPIIPGLKPLSSKKQLSIIPSIFHVDIPIELSDAFQSAKNPADVEQIGTEWLIQQSLELKKAGVPVLHYYTLGKPAMIRKVLEKVF
jgi:methylenetetrahydrofolate reductase (NADPH)